MIISRILGLLICTASLLLGVNTEVMRNGIMAQLNGFGLTNGNGSELGRMLSNILADPQAGLILRAEQALKQRLSQTLDSFNVSDACINHTEVFLKGLVERQTWAFKMIDSMGKPPPGLMEGNLNWLGSFDQCLTIDVHVNTSTFTGRYCTASTKIPQIEVMGTPAALNIGLCVPNSCDDTDTTALLETLLSLVPINASSLPHPKVKCQKENLELDTKAKIVIGVMSIFGFIMVVATAYDVIVVQFLSKTEPPPDYEITENECAAIKVTRMSSEQYGTSGSLKSIEANGSLSNGGSQYDLQKSTRSLVKKEQKYQPGKLGQLLLSFSVYTNATKILNTDQPKGTLSVINGMRFISMTWVIMGHSFGATIQFSTNSGTFVVDMLKRFTFQAIANATVSVDTFFVLSGLLVSYLGLKELKKRGGAKKFNWGMFYFHRFWRLTPPYMLFLMFYVCLEKYWSSGPLWPQEGTEIDDCKDSWWWSLLYVNNLINPGKQCMGWGWYLANDMQFYVLSPLMLIPLYYSKILGTLSCSAFLLCSVISTWIISATNNLGPSILVADRAMGRVYYEKIYVKPWCRVGPYAIGFFTGYLLYKTDCKAKLPKVVNLIGWTLATGTALSVLYGLYDSDSIFPKLSVQVSAFYSAVHRSAWALAICWVIFACATGHGGFVNTLLSWKALIPLSRLTYCTYLVHLVVMDVYQNSKRSLVYFTDLEEIYWFVAHVVMSYATAFVVSLTFEAPMMGLEKALLGRGKHS